MAASLRSARLDSAKLVLLAGCAVACLVQVWWSWHTVHGAACDFPEDCVERYFPPVYEQLKVLWIVGTFLAMALVIVTALTEATRPTRIRVGVVAATMALWFFLTPILWFGVGFGRDQHPVQVDTMYRIGLLALLCAVALIAWELAERANATARPSGTEPEKVSSPSGHAEP